ncbi:MAG: response regulator [Spirochaetaceae bacterium]|nr:MAG: response regulator [Spirochaetaceae bacterium]
MSDTARILIVDDDQSLCKLLVRSLQKAGFEAEAVSSGAEALDTARDNADLILLLDQRLPDMTGQAIAHAIAAEGLPNAFIMMTGQGDERLAVDMMKLGAADYLLKDTSLLDVLPSAIRGLLRNQETARKLRRAEADLRTRLAEKEALLREVHHRVKNNLSIISSLLSLQADAISTPEGALYALEKSRNRVFAMALVHEKMYQSHDSSRIDMQDYLSDLRSQLFSTWRPEGVEVQCRSTSICLDIGTAIPLGLIIDELVSNAIRHAFPDKRPGLVNVELRTTADGFMELEVSDNGVGLPDACLENGDPTGGLGLVLVKLLSEQLGAELSRRSHDGSWFCLRFPHATSGSNHAVHDTRG